MSDFDKTADVVHTNRFIGVATQHQHATLLPNSITVSGRFDGTAPSFAGAGYAKGRTITDIHFDITEATDRNADAGLVPVVSRLRIKQIHHFGQ